MYRTGVILGALLGLMTLWPAQAADLPLHPYEYQEGFERGTLQLTEWATNGTPGEVHWNGPTEERAFEGKRSLKLDVTLGDGTYSYWGVTLRVPCAGRVKMTARLLVGPETTARVGFGYNVVFPPSRHSGCSAVETYYKPTEEWKTVEVDLVQAGRASADHVMRNATATASGRDVGVYLDRWSVFLYGGKGQRAVVYLDDIRLSGEIPAEEDYRKQIEGNWSRAVQLFLKRVGAWEKELEQTRRALGGLEEAPPGSEAIVAAIKTAAERTGGLLASMRKAGYASAGEIAEVEGGLATLRYGPQTVEALARAQAAGCDFLVYPRGQAVSCARFPSGPALLTTVAGGSLSCLACRGEYESLSAVVLAAKEVKGLQVLPSALRGRGATIPAAAVDIRVLKWWYQGASSSIGYSPKKALVAELLLKDDRLVRVDTERQDNCLRSTAEDGTETYEICSNPDSSNLANVRPVDATQLQPVDLAAGEAREFWINVHVPERAPAGDYEGAVIFRTEAGKTAVPLKVTVHPFDLEPPRLIYSLYYRASLSPDGKPTIGSERKSEEQYRAEMADLKAHGVLYPTSYAGWDEAVLTWILTIRREVGLPAGIFFNLGYGPRAASGEALKQVQDEVRKWLGFLRPWGYDQVHFYGLDEATGERLTSQRAAWKAVQEAGGKTFVACYKGTFEAMGSLLNCAVLAGPPDPEEAKKWHSVGSLAFCYANPQVGVENPMIYRRNFGLVLWRAGFDGAMDYAYQHGFHHIWNDFDDRSCRDHVFAYPTLNGVVGTIQWEGFREGVDDVRYVTTLEKAIAQPAPGKERVAWEARQWLRGLDVAKADLDEARRELVRWILALKEE